MVHFVRPDASIKSFREYADMKVIPYVERQLANTKRVDVIWDRYLPDSLKATTRRGGEQESDSGCDMMGMGNFRKIGTSICRTQVTRWNCSIICTVDIAETVFCEGKVVMSTLDEDVLGSPVLGADESEYPLRPCNHEEFDTRVMFHAANAVSHGYQRILIIANDTNIIVLGISFFSDIGADKLWVSFGIAYKLRNILIDGISSAMSSSKAKALPAFHALTG